MKLNFDTIIDFCHLVSDTFDLTTFFITPTGEITFESKNNQIINPLYENEKGNLFNALDFVPNKERNFPVIRKTEFSEYYIIISVISNNTFKGTVLIGPSVSYPLSEEILNGFIKDTNAFSYREQVFDYFKSIPIVKHEKKINISIVAFHMFNKILLSSKTIISQNKELIEPIEINKKLNLAVSKGLQTMAFHPDPLLEKRFLNIVKEGRVEDLNEDSSDITDEETVSVLSRSSYIRSLKNQIIVLIALVSRAAIEGGLHSEIAYTLGVTFIQRLEELNSFNEIKSLTREVRYTFTYKVSQVKKERYSNTIAICQNYIFTNMYEEINHNDIAEKVGLSPKYLSALFKKEVGITVSEYSQEVKIDEAKRLISYSDTPLSEISALLNFSDQSYFTKVFKKHVRITPRQYREKSHLLIE